MSEQSNQGGAAKSTPPIPVMDQAAPAPAPNAAQISQQVHQIAADAKKAATEAKALAKGTSTSPTPAIATTAPPAFDPSNLIPPQVVEITEAFFFTVAFCVVGFPLARALGRWIDRRGAISSSNAPDLRPQMQQLQQSVDAMAIELERISEGQRFTTKVLTERSGSST